MPESKMRRDLRLLNEAMNARDKHEAATPGAKLERERQEAIRKLNRDWADPTSYLRTCPAFRNIVGPF